jgi:beta-lactam-binding protein with PASTA domain
MANTFTITTTATDTLKADDKGHTEAVFTVANTTARPVRSMARAKALDNTKQEWLQIAGESERDFGPASTQQFVVTFDAPVATAPPSGPTTAGAQPPGSATPTGAAADKYSFRLDVASARNPDEDFTQGPVVKVELPLPKPVPPPKPFPKWVLLPIAAVVLIGIAVGLYFALRKTDVPVPNVVGMTIDDAKAALQNAKLTPVEKEVQITEKAPPGQVIAQDPKPESSPVPKGTEVALITEGEVPLVEVPDVTKRLITDAKERLLERGLSVVETSTDVTEGLQPNQVVSQVPAGGQRVKPNATVELVVAVQRQITVPDVTFRPANLAQQQITAAGLQFIMKDPELAPANVAAGNIKSQNPGGGEKVPPGSTIELVAAAQPTTVPNLVGKRIAEAQIVLQQNGLELGNVSGTVNESNANTVLITSQDPDANRPTARGARVNVAVPAGCAPRCIFTTVDVGIIRRLDPEIRAPLILRRQSVVQP